MTISAAVARYAETLSKAECSSGLPPTTAASSEWSSNSAMAIRTTALRSWPRPSASLQRTSQEWRRLVSPAGLRRGFAGGPHPPESCFMLFDRDHSHLNQKGNSMVCYASVRMRWMSSDKPPEVGRREANRWGAPPPRERGMFGFGIRQRTESWSTSDEALTPSWQSVGQTLSLFLSSG